MPAGANWADFIQLSPNHGLIKKKTPLSRNSDISNNTATDAQGLDFDITCWYHLDFKCSSSFASHPNRLNFEKGIKRAPRAYHFKPPILTCEINWKQNTFSSRHHPGLHSSSFYLCLYEICWFMDTFKIQMGQTATNKSAKWHQKHDPPDWRWWAFYGVLDANDAPEAPKRLRVSFWMTVCASW